MSEPIITPAAGYTFGGVNIETVDRDWLYRRAVTVESGCVTANAEPVYAE